MESMAEGMIKDLVASGHALADDMTGAPSVLIRCLAAQLEVQLVRANALAAENAGLKHAMAVTLEHVSVTDAGQAGVAAMIINDALHHSETPATDAFLAEVWAQGVEMFADNLLCPDLDDTIRDFAAQLRKGVQS
ncbi:hypothetical protein BKC75_13160 [Salmonella enterica subsp. enterica serovar Muenchen]|nr:hypothetical protein [Salmonella enterica]EDC8051003.1 hypothetical protein [Salmonella enterica subsp. enterica serovar Muenchen]EEM9539859.1 hypothetical protein [Salmonella enterica]EEN0873574.1 hypothetical protein [Salmonella enterica]EEN1611127.1 hypothetical protein [Salmonella enterica]